MSIDFPQNARWFNTSKPLSLHYDLGGQIVLLFFWTKNCIHCQHVLADLAQLRRRYQNQPLAFIGVHMDKYPASLPGLESAIERLNIPFPVLADTDRVLWNAYQVTMWPTLALLGPAGNLIGVVSGEGHFKLLENAINRALAAAASAGTLAPAPLQPLAPPSPRPQSPLLFPTKILADKSKNRLAILDTGHHRILLTSWPDAADNITLQQTIGSGEIGNQDGDLANASFNSPQGLAFSGRGDTLFVADTANHLIRRIDLAPPKKDRVLTILGTGQQLFDHEAGKSGRDQGLNAPWDLAVHANRLYIAQAGQHQILSVNLMTLATEVAAGTSRLDLRDGPSERANLAQPSALALDPASQTLYFTDAQSSSLRVLDLKTKTVTTLIGKGLFDFGDIVGPFPTARLTHPLALAFSPNALYLADTLNHKIKHANLLTRTLTTLPIQLPLNEPAGLTLSPDSPADLFIADTNHHRLLLHNLTTHETKQLILHAKQSP